MIKHIKPILLSLLLISPAVAVSQQGDDSNGASNTTDDATTQSNSPQATKQVTPPDTGAATNAGKASPAPSAAPTKEEGGSATPPKDNDGASEAQSGESAASEALKASKEEEEKKKAQETASEVIEKGGLIAGKFQISITESYTHSQSSQLYIQGFGIIPILTVGNIDVQNVRRDVFTTVLSANYKLTNRLQVSMSVPWQYTMSSVSKATGLSGSSPLSPNTEQKNQSSSLGDISAGVSYQLVPQGLVMPNLTGGLNFKSRSGRDFFETPDPAAHVPAGTGFYALSGSLSWSKTSAPAVVYGSFGYSYSFARRNIPYTANRTAPILIKSYEPGASMSISLGMSLSLNYQLSLNWGLGMSHSFSSRVNGNVSPNSATNSITYRMGGIWHITDTQYIDISMTTALDADAGGTTVSVRIPWNY